MTLLLWLLLAAGCREDIVHNLSEGEANRLLSRLHESEIEARKERQPDGKWMLSVSSDASRAALKLLDSSRLLRFDESPPEPGSSLVMSREEQRHRSERMMSAGIGRTIASLQGVLEAHVHLNLPPRDPLFGQRSFQHGGSASVLVVADSAAKINRDDIVAIVAGAAGVEARAVSVVVSSSAMPRSRGTGDKSAPAIEVPAGSAHNLPVDESFRSWLVWLAAGLMAASGLLALALWRSTPRLKEVA